MSAILSQGSTQAPHDLQGSRVGHSVDKPSTAAASSKEYPYGDVKTKISFLSDTAPRAKGELYFWTGRAPEGQPQTTVGVQEREVTVHDLRPLTDAERRQRGFVTDHAGFEVVQGFGDDDATRKAWADEAWQSEEWIKEAYYKDVDALLKKRFGATSTFIFDHTLRKRDPTADELNPDQRQPVNRLHIDQSHWAGLERVKDHLGAEMYERAKANVGNDTGLNIKLVNVWRPLRDNIDNDWPLAVGDYRTFSEDDMVVAELRNPGKRTGETLAISHSSTQKFYYLSGHRADEATLLKCWDLKDATKTPHTAFEHPGSGENARPRWSIEVRALVVTDADARR